MRVPRPPPLARFPLSVALSRRQRGSLRVRIPAAHMRQQDRRAGGSEYVLLTTRKHTQPRIIPSFSRNVTAMSKRKDQPGRVGQLLVRHDPANGYGPGRLRYY